VRLRRLETEFAGRLRTAHRSFVLVPEDRIDRTFRDYHRAHRQAAARQDEDAPRFQIPDAGHPYPRCSLPALEAGIWVRDTYPDRFAAFDLAVFEAFFSRTEDISDLEVLRRLADRCGLDGAALAEVVREGRCRERVLAEYQEALDMGIRGVPAVAIPGGPPIVGAVPYPDLRRAIETALRGSGRA
jgi:predicted DsbA family dithiol-disulfide isomerase